jgi:hypothetical protein
MTPGRNEEFNADDAILTVIRDFEKLSITLRDAITGLRRQPGSDAMIASLERALEKARAGAQLARDLSSGNRERET